MTKEELKQDAEDFLDKMVTDKGIILGCHEGFCYDEVIDFMSEFAEPKERKIKELEAQIEKVKHYLDYDIPHDLINEATTKIWRMLK